MTLILIVAVVFMETEVAGFRRVAASSLASRHLRLSRAKVQRAGPELLLSGGETLVSFSAKILLSGRANLKT